jgi:hypothetical protein
LIPTEPPPSRATLRYRRAGDGLAAYLSLVPTGGRSGIELMLQRVPERKQGKNRLHLDPRVGDLDAEVERIGGFGASRVTERPVEEAGWRWHVLVDPEGNESCVLQSPPDRPVPPSAAGSAEG